MTPLEEIDAAEREAHKSCQQDCHSWGDHRGGMWHQECHWPIHPVISTVFQFSRKAEERRVMAYDAVEQSFLQASAINERLIAMKARAEAAEARVRELEAERAELVSALRTHNG